MPLLSKSKECGKHCWVGLSRFQRCYPFLALLEEIMSLAEKALCFESEPFSSA